MPKDPKSPEVTSDAYDAMKNAWNKIQTVLDGTDDMRSAGRIFLPQHFGESNDSYKERLERNTLLNLTKLTLTSWVGRPFSKPMTFTDVPPAIEALFTNIDLVGNDVQVYGRDWFSDGLSKSYSHTLIDFPRTDAEGVRTLRDDRAENIRPHWIHIRPEDLFFADAEMVNGREVLREIRIMEEVTERDGFAEVFQPQIRRITMFEDEGGRVRLYRLADPRQKDKREWILHDEYPFSLPVIPLVTFYSNREAFMLGQPPLEDLADLNIAHWQSTSDQRAVLTVARFPILSVSGGTVDGKEIVVGPRRLLYSPDPQARFSYVEHTGKAIEAGQKDLESLETNMAEYGAEFLKRRPGSITATQRTLDTAEATSPLQDTAIRFGHSMTQALNYTAMWMKLEEGGTAEVYTDFSFSGDQTDLNFLRDLRKMREISRVALLTESQRRGVLADGYDMEADELLLEEEALKMMPADVDFESDDDEDVDVSES